MSKLKDEGYLSIFPAWKNSDNHQYYENIPIEKFFETSVKGGLEEGSDIEQFYHYLINTNSILELGAGYGRVIKNILQRGYKGLIYAVEKSNKKCEYLSKNYKNKIQLICTDLLSFHPNFKVNAILFLWSSISDFSKSEQPLVLKHITSWLNPNGLVILDTLFPNSLPKNATISYDKNQSCIGSAEHGTLYGYIPTSDEIYKYASQAKLKVIEQINYETNTARKRVIYVLRSDG
ncbi:MAG: class I SAM-dependent methyltransferase [Gammaproteobacteria bacterium]|nr:class I SAM-dependent methyltransferase [Gammaproteobacteria bacterium]